MMAGVDAPTLLTGRVVTPDGVLEDGAVLLEGDRIAWVGPRSEVAVPEASTPDGWPTGYTLLPGLVDLHCHGGAGGEFGPDVDSARTAAAHHRRHGTTSLVGSLVSAPGSELVAGAAACAELVADGTLAGIHLEGPFLSVARCGAQDPTALIDPDPALVEAIVTAGAGGVVQMTFAPERPGAYALMAQLASAGVVPAVGHTDADAGTARAALDRILALGARGSRPLVTHVFNGMPPLHHRSPGPVAAALGSAGRGEAVLEAIGDGVHLAAETVRMLFETVGPDALALVTDSMAASGMPEGRYTLGGRDVVVEDRTVRLAQGGSIAGGVATLLDVVRWCVNDVGLPIADVVTAASGTPASVMGWTDVGALEAGRRADLVVVEDALEPVQVIRAGAWLA